MNDVTSLCKLLDEERVAILSGTFDDLTRFSRLKEEMLARISRTTVPGKDLRRIAADVSRNQTLLASAIEGVRSVVERMGELRRVRDGFDSYGPQGARTKVGVRKPAFERKA